LSVAKEEKGQGKDGGEKILLLHRPFLGGKKGVKVFKRSFCVLLDPPLHEKKRRKKNRDSTT